MQIKQYTQTQITAQEINRIRYSIEDFPQKIGSLRGKKTVFVLGNTGAGKSTAINYLLGCQMQKEQDLVSSAITIPEDGKKIAPVGYSNDSMTLIPEMYINDDEPLLAYFDCPGFQENRGRVEKTAASIATEMAVRLAKESDSLLAMIVIDIHSLTTTRAADFKDLAATLGELLKQPETLVDSVLFVYTHCEIVTKETKRKLIEKTKSLMSSSTVSLQAKQILSLMHKNLENIVVIDVFDNGESRKEIIHKLKALKSAPKESFDFKKYDPDREIFDMALFSLIGKGQTMIENLMSWSSKLQNDKLTLLECEDKVPFYEEQIKKFDVPFSIEEKSKHIGVFEEKIKANIHPLKRIVESLNQLKVSISTNEISLSKINKTDKIPYWKAEFQDERWRWFIWGPVMRTQSRHIFEHQMSFIADDLEINEKSTNGNFNSLRTPSKDQGLYRSEYISDRGKDGNATVEILIRTCDKPDNKIQIQHLFNKLDESKKIYTGIEAQKVSLEQENRTFQKALDALRKETAESQALLLQQKNDLQIGQRTNTQKIKTLKDNILTIEKNLKQLKLDFENYDYECTEVSVIKFVALPDKELLDKNYRENLPMLISCDDSVWFYAFDEKYRATKLVLLENSDLYRNICYSTEMPQPYKLPKNILDDLQSLSLKNNCAFFLNNRSVFEVVNIISCVLKYDSDLMSSFIESMGTLAKSNILQQQSDSQDQILFESFFAMSKNSEVSISGYECIISSAIMIDPVIAGCGHSFERQSITKYLCMGNNTCPCCKQKIHANDLRPNINLKMSIDAWHERQESKYNLYSSSLDAFQESTDEAKKLSAGLETQLKKLNKKESQLAVRKNLIDQFLIKRSEESKAEVADVQQPYVADVEQSNNQKVPVLNKFSTDS